MKRVIAAAAMVLATSASAMALPWIGSFNTGSSWVNNVQSLDWDANAQGMVLGIAPGSPLAVGSTVDFIYQSKLVGFDLSDFSTVVAPAGYEYTLVTHITETVTSFGTDSAGVQTAQFSPVSGTAYMYYDGTPNSNNTTGYGFDDGTQVLKANVLKGSGDSSFSFNPTKGTGTGSVSEMSFFLQVTDVNGAYIQDNTTFAHILFSGTLNFPPQFITASYFDGRSGEGNYAPISTTDNAGNLVGMPLKVDGYSSVVTPEPSTFALLGAGLLGAGFMARRKNKK